MKMPSLSPLTLTFTKVVFLPDLKGEDEWLGTDASLKADGPLQLVLYGFDEVGDFDSEFKTPAYAFVRQSYS